MYELRQSNDDQGRSASIEVRPVAPTATPATAAWEVVRDGEVIHAASSENGALDYAHGLIGSPLPRRRR